MLFEFMKVVIERIIPATNRGELAFLSKIESDPAKIAPLKAS
jgi:hypothetical protein